MQEMIEKAASDYWKPFSERGIILQNVSEEM